MGTQGLGGGWELVFNGGRASAQEEEPSWR